MRAPRPNVDGKELHQTDSVMVEAMIYPSDDSNSDPVVTIHPLKSKDSVLVKVQPPSGPSDGTVPHIPCDIVLVIDVSGSMNAIAPPPGGGKDVDGNIVNETCDLSVLDLTKHAARTILSTLNESDRLAIVTFSSGVEVVQKLAPMTQENKKQVTAKLKTIKAHDMTNLWGGISEGLKQLPLEPNGRVPALMVLTDGQPNFLCPNQGYVKKIRSLSYQTAATINTFGFGYEVRPGLLRSIAEVSNGNFSFIPDAGMIGTVFVHAVAHLQTTYATGAVLEVRAPKGVLLNTTTGHSIDQPDDRKTGAETIKLPLGNLQYGQSRDIYLEIVDASGRQTECHLSKDGGIINAQLMYSRMQSPQYAVLADQDIRHTTSLPQSVIDYHRSRSMICRFLLSRFPIHNCEYKDEPALAPKVTDSAAAGMIFLKQDLQALIENIPARLHEDTHNRSLMADLTGQIKEGINSLESLRRWGRHYFYSLGNAHANQLCNSFKDPGPLMYNDDPFFTRCRDALDNAFDSLPPPAPTETFQEWGSRGWGNQGYGYRGYGYHEAGNQGQHLKSSRGFSSYVTMASYNDPAAVCFTSTTPVTLYAGSEIPIRELRRGMTVHTPMGPRGVRALVQTMVDGMTMYRVGNAVATPWHPVKKAGEDGSWAFPVDVAEETVTYSGPVYSVMLETDTNPEAHTICVGGVWAVALGHGITCGDDFRAHRFYGDRDAVYKALLTIGDREQNGIYYVGAPLRDANGEVCGFLPPP